MAKVDGAAFAAGPAGSIFIEAEICTVTKVSAASIAAGIGREVIEISS